MEKFTPVQEKIPAEKVEALLFAENFKIVKEKPTYKKELFAEVKKLSAEGLKNYFENNSFTIHPPLPLIQENSTTLFVSAGVQVLDSSIHEEKELPSNPIFINQPVFRSQFLGSNAIESHTSFHNPTTIDVNVSLIDHISHLKKWIEYLVSQGFDKNEFVFNVANSEPKWGNRKFSNIVIGIFYGGLDIGDAVYIPFMPQNNRTPFSISDIGFGLERLQHSPENPNTIKKDCLKTLALLAISGVRPGNKNHGYRFRLFSKKFISECDLNFQKMTAELSTIRKLLNFWSASVSNPIEDNEILIEKITLECERNFNREILNYLKNKFEYKHDIQINQKTKEFLVQLRKIGDRPAEFWDELETKTNF